jgi:hypothetical protein
VARPFGVSVEDMSTSTPATDAIAPLEATDAETLHQLIFGAVATKIVAVAAEIGLAERLARGNQTAATLAADTGTHPEALFRLLRALAGLGMVRQAGPDRFELTELGARLRPDSPDSVHAVATMLWGQEGWAAWDRISTSVRTGRPGWDEAHGQTWVDYYDTHPDAAATFNRAMSQHTRDAAPALVDACDVKRFATIVDVGGGDGMLLGRMLAAGPHLDGVLFDLPAGLTAAPATLEEMRVADRCRIAPGNFFDEVPPGADAYVLKQILHDWPDERAVEILRRCRDAMGPGSRLLVLERLLPDVADAGHAGSLLLDMHMLVVTGGRERTLPEFRDLLDASGFRLTGVAGPLLPFGYHVLEATTSS